jgi:hypothetical protein
MKVDFAFICDYADARGKINALGIGFDTIYAPKVPVKHPIFSFVLQLRTSAEDFGAKKIEVHLTDDDGKDIISAINRTIQLRRPATGAESIARLALQFGNVQFPRHGHYSIRAVLDGHEIASVPLNVSLPPKQLPGAQPPSIN